MICRISLNSEYILILERKILIKTKLISILKVFIFFKFNTKSQVILMFTDSKTILYYNAKAG